MNCEAGHFCLSSERAYALENSEECTPAPAGCSASAMCDCKSLDLKGAKQTGCVAISRVSTVYVTDYSCGDAPCESGEICLSPRDESAPSCVAPPDGCAVDSSFCQGDCDDQTAEAAGLELVSCEYTTDGGVGVFVR